MIFVVTALAHAASVYTPEDLVFAWSTRLPDATGTQVAASVGAHADTAVYLLRRGVPADTLARWGFAVTDAELTEAATLGPLAAPSPVSDTDWREMAELPTAIAAADRTVRGDVVAVVPTRAVLEHRGATYVVERPEARDVWVDARPIDLAVRDTLAEDEPARSLPARVVHQRRGGTGVAVGGLLMIAGGVTFLAGASGPNPNMDSGWGSGGGDYAWALQPAELLIGGRTTAEPSPLLMIAGAGVVTLGGLSFTFGADQLRLAANDRGAWLDQHPIE